MGDHIEFHGGAGTVTGSRHLLVHGDRRVLVDCGLFQGLKELRLRNWSAPGFEPSGLDEVLLTHAHIDHSGYLPRLVAAGYGGPVRCTPPTAELLGIMLRDSARLQEEDARWANRKGYSRHHPARPLYTERDAERALSRLVPVGYGEWVELGRDLRARFHNVGHILGSAMVEVERGGPAGGGGRTIVFSGDVGRYGALLHRDPLPPPACDELVVESTYGDRVHDHAPLADQLVGPLSECFARGGKALFPSFAVGRAQQVTLLLRELMESGRLHEVPIHIDSPMATDATRLYSRYNDETQLDEWLSAGGQSRLFPRRVHFHRSVDESRELNGLAGPRVIISSSGMLAGGRVLHHLRRVAPNPDDLLCLVGYQAAGTRGRKILEGASHVRLHGRDVPVRCHTLVLHGLSAHADREELLRWVGSGPVRPGVAFVVHGEEAASGALAGALRDRLGIAGVIVPAHGERQELGRARRSPWGP